MVFQWWLFNSFRNKLDVGSKGSQMNTSINKSENHEINSQINGFKSWIYKLFSKPAEKNNIIENDCHVSSNEQKKRPFYMWFFRRENVPQKIMSIQVEENEEEWETFDEFFTNLQKEITIAKKEIIASSVASIVSTFISHPFSVVRSKFLSLRYPRELYEQKIRRPRVGYIVKDIIITKGWKRFYKGYWISQIDSLSQAISMFWTYQTVYEVLVEFEKLKSHPSLISFIGGFISATIPVMALHPIALHRKRRLLNKKLIEMYGPVAGRVAPYKVNYFRGCLPLYLYLGTLYGLRFLFFNKIYGEMLLQSAREKNGNTISKNASESSILTKLPAFQLLLAAGSAAILGDLLAHPLDVIHSRITMSTLRRQHFRFENTCNGIGQCFKRILRNEGILAFYVGLYPGIMRSTVNTAIQFAVYEQMKTLLKPILFA